MNLQSTIQLFCSIGDDAIRILHKKIGKTKGLDSIEDQIRETATKAAEKSYGGKLDRVAQKHIDRYVDKRMGYMRDAFVKLNNPLTDTSKKRGEFIGDTETRSAKEFGQAKGYERLAKSKGKQIYKAWNNNEDACEVCEENADEGPIPIDEEFPSGDFAPQAHPNCSCYLTFSDDDGNEFEYDYDEENVS